MSAVNALRARPASLPVDIHDPSTKPAPELCPTCGRAVPWSWLPVDPGRGPLHARLAPRGGWWCRPPVRPCGPDCRGAGVAPRLRAAAPTDLEVEVDVDATLAAAGVPARLIGASLARSCRIADGEDLGAFRARTRASKAIGVTPDNARAFVAVRDFVGTDGWLALHGPVGVGKTVLLAAALRAHVEAKRGTVLYVTADQLAGAEGRMWRGDGEQWRSAGISLLAVDELGASTRPTRAEQDILERVIDWRYRQQMPTLFATNRPWSELIDEHASPYGARVADRMAEMVGARAIVVAGTSWRRETT
jgi:hypothetical protein